VSAYHLQLLENKF